MSLFWQGSKLLKLTSLSLDFQLRSRFQSFCSTTEDRHRRFLRLCVCKMVANGVFLIGESIDKRSSMRGLNLDDSLNWRLWGHTGWYPQDKKAAVGSLEENKISLQEAVALDNLLSQFKYIMRVSLRRQHSRQGCCCNWKDFANELLKPVALPLSWWE